jgi:SSS family solute:Na+ symporter
MYTSVLQTPVLLIGSIVILVVGLIKVGGWVEVERIVGDNIHLVRPASDPEFPWTGVLFGSAIIGFWYWCTDQYIVQRVLSGRNQQQARRGAILAGYFKLLPVFIFLIPGMIAYALNQKGLLQVESSDSAFAAMVAQLLPAGMTGVVVCGLLAALMSSLASLFNSSSMLFVEDFYKKMRPERDEKHYLIVGRIATAVVVILGVVWIPVMLGLGKVLYEYLQGVQGLLAPAIASVFLLGVFWKKMNAKAALWGMITGFSIGMFRLILNVVYGTKVALITGCEKAIQSINNATDTSLKQVQEVVNSLNDKITSVASAAGTQAKESVETANALLSAGLTPESKHQAIQLISQTKETFSQMYLEQSGLLFRIASINWLHFCVILFLICIATMVSISLMTAPPSASNLQYTYAAATAADKKATRASWNKWDIIHTVIILSIVVAFYIYFW